MTNRLVIRLWSNIYGCGETFAKGIKTDAHEDVHCYTPLVSLGGYMLALGLGVVVSPPLVLVNLASFQTGGSDHGSDIQNHWVNPHASFQDPWHEVITIGA